MNEQTNEEKINFNLLMINILLTAGPPFCPGPPVEKAPPSDEGP
jgi:hypothetical protein